MPCFHSGRIGGILRGHPDATAQIAGCLQGFFYGVGVHVISESVVHDQRTIARETGQGLPHQIGVIVTSQTFDLNITAL